MGAKCFVVAWIHHAGIGLIVLENGHRSCVASVPGVNLLHKITGFDKSDPL